MWPLPRLPPTRKYKIIKRKSGRSQSLRTHPTTIFPISHGHIDPSLSLEQSNHKQRKIITFAKWSKKIDFSIRNGIIFQGTNNFPERVWWDISTHNFQSQRVLILNYSENKYELSSLLVYFVFTLFY